MFEMAEGYGVLDGHGSTHSSPSISKPTPAPSQGLPPSQIQLYQQIDEYPWAADAEFQTGLNTILKPEHTAAQTQSLTLRARCFYYARKNACEVDPQAYEQWHAASRPSSLQTAHAPGHHGLNLSTSVDAPLNAPIDDPASAKDAIPSDNSQPPATVAGASHHTNPNSQPQNSNDAADPPYPPKFHDVVEMIANGQPVPGIREIPNDVLEGQSSASTHPPRLKPWEVQ